MAKIPRFQQTSIFQPQTTDAPTQGFQALQKLFGAAGQEVQKLGEQQVKSEQLIGANQVQNSIRGLTASATVKFPGDFAKQQEFVNKGAQSFLSQYIPTTTFANRGYFKALSKNLLTEVNVKFARNIEAQNLKNQKTILDNNINNIITNSVISIRNGNPKLTKNNIGLMMNRLDAGVKGSIIKPQAQQNYHQKGLMAFNIAGSKNQIDGALAAGGVDAAKRKLGEILADKNNRLLANPKTASIFTSAIRSYTNGVTSGLKASQGANKDQIKDVVNNARLTGVFDTQKVNQLGIEDKVSDAIAVHNKAWELFTSSPLDKQDGLNALDLGDKTQLAIKNTVGDLETTYNKDPMGFLISQLAKQQGLELANATPEQSQQIRSAAVQIQQQRQDVQIKPLSNLEMQPTLTAAKSGQIDDFNNAYNQVVDTAGKFNQSAQIQLGQALKKVGVDSSVEEIGYLGDTRGLVAQQILSGSTQDIKTLRLSAETKLGISSSELSEKLRKISAAAIKQDNFFSTSTNFKFISSLKNGAGNFQGVVLGGHQQNMERYMLSTLSLNQNSSLTTAAQQYNDAFANSFNYAIQRNSQYIRIPLQYRGRPLDAGKVKDVLNVVQKTLQMKDVDLSDVRPNVHTSQELARQRYWSTSGSMNSWVTAPDGESYLLLDAQGKTLNSAKTKQPIRVRNSDIVEDPSGISKILFVRPTKAPTVSETRIQRETALRIQQAAVGAAL